MFVILSMTSFFLCCNFFKLVSESLFKVCTEEQHLEIRLPSQGVIHPERMENRPKINISYIVILTSTCAYTYRKCT